MSVLTGSGYPISRTTGRCAATGRELVVGERYMAVLVEREGVEQIERADFSLESWESGARPAPPARVFASWRAVIQDSSSRKPAFLSDDELLELFERLAEATEPKRLAFRYLLALMLVRRKALKYEGTRDGILTVRPRTPSGAPEAPAMTVADPRLDEHTVTAAMDQLGEIMSLDETANPARATA